MKNTLSNKRDVNNHMYQPHVNQSMNDNIFMRSSLNTIHGDKYKMNDINRSQSLEKL